MKTIFRKINDNKRVAARYIINLLLPVAAVLFLIYAALNLNVDISNLGEPTTEGIILLVASILTVLYALIHFVEFIKYQRIFIEKAKAEANKRDLIDAEKISKEAERLSTKAEKKLDRIERR